VKQSNAQHAPEKSRSWDFEALFPSVSSPKDDSTVQKELSKRASELRGLTKDLVDSSKAPQAYNELLSLAVNDPRSFAESLVFWLPQKEQRNKVLTFYRDLAESEVLAGSGKATIIAKEFKASLPAVENAITDVYVDKIYDYLTAGSFVKEDPLHPNAVKQLIKARVLENSKIRLVLPWGGYKETPKEILDYADEEALERLSSICANAPSKTGSGLRLEVEIVFCDVHAREFNSKPHDKVSRYLDDLSVKLFLSGALKHLHITPLSTLYSKWRETLGSEQLEESRRDCESWVRNFFTENPEVAESFKENSIKHSNFCSPQLFSCMAHAIESTASKKIKSEEASALFEKLGSGELSKKEFSTQLSNMLFPNLEEGVKRSVHYMSAPPGVSEASPVFYGLLEKGPLESGKSALQNAVSKAVNSAGDGDVRRGLAAKLRESVTKAIRERLVYEVAVHYAATRRMESFLLGTVRPDSLFLSFGDPRKEKVFSSLPTLFYYPLRKFSDTPWYTNGDLLFFRDLEGDLTSPNGLDAYKSALTTARVRLPKAYELVGRCMRSWLAINNAIYQVAGEGEDVGSEKKKQGEPLNWSSKKDDEALTLFSALIFFSNLSPSEKVPIGVEDDRVVSQFLALNPFFKYGGRIGFPPLSRVLPRASESGFFELDGKVKFFRESLGALSLYESRKDATRAKAVDVLTGIIEEEGAVGCLEKLEERLMEEVRDRYAGKRMPPEFWAALNYDCKGKSMVFREEIAREHVSRLVESIAESLPEEIVAFRVVMADDRKKLAQIEEELNFSVLPKEIGEPPAASARRHGIIPVMDLLRHGQGVGEDKLRLGRARKNQVGASGRKQVLIRVPASSYGAKSYHAKSAKQIVSSGSSDAELYSEFSARIKEMFLEERKRCFNLQENDCARVAQERDIVAEQALLFGENLASGRHSFWGMVPHSLAWHYGFSDEPITPEQKSMVKKAYFKFRLKSSETAFAQAQLSAFLLSNAFDSLESILSSSRKRRVSRKQLEMLVPEVSAGMAAQLDALRQDESDMFYSSESSKVMLFDDIRDPSSLTQEFCYTASKKAVEALSSKIERESGNSSEWASGKTIPVKEVLEMIRASKEPAFLLQFFVLPMPVVKSSSSEARPSGEAGEDVTFDQFFKE